jgi:hypothetical protein
MVIELTSQSTREEDLDDKFWLYRDVLKVQEYFLFDPHQECLSPQLQGYRLIDGQFVRIEMVDGRLYSEVLGLWLEPHCSELRLYDPVTRKWLPTPAEAAQLAEQARQQAELQRQQAEAGRRAMEVARQQSEAQRHQAEADRSAAEEAQRQSETARQQADLARQQAEAARLQAEAENERLKKELERLRGAP